MVNCQKIITERWPQIDLYFLSKPEVEKKTYSRGNVLRNFNMVCILSDVNKIDPNLTFRSSRTPSVCQYKHQSLVTFVILQADINPTVFKTPKLAQGRGRSFALDCPEQTN